LKLEAVETYICSYNEDYSYECNLIQEKSSDQSLLKQSEIDYFSQLQAQPIDELFESHPVEEVEF
jgi:hypothetical protein